MSEGKTVPRFPFIVPLVLAAFAFFFTGSSAFAEDVKWRNDYAAARKEAAETGRTLLLDFGTEACFWCKKLDATTFRDPKVVKLLNERFIPVKIDGNKYQQLTNSLRVESFPTLILVTHDGKVLGRRDGYADVAELMALLGKAPAPLAPKPVAAETPKPQPPKPSIDAELAALFPEIAASLGH
jgi:thioredoxin-related protein